MDVLFMTLPLPSTLLQTVHHILINFEFLNCPKTPILGALSLLTTLIGG